MIWDKTKTLFVGAAHVVNDTTRSLKQIYFLKSRSGRNNNVHFFSNGNCQHYDALKIVVVLCLEFFCLLMDIYLIILNKMFHKICSMQVFRY